MTYKQPLSREEFRARESLFYIVASEEDIKAYELLCDLMKQNKVPLEEKNEACMQWFEHNRNPKNPPAEG